jgi:hypothetical protein
VLRRRPRPLLPRPLLPRPLLPRPPRRTRCRLRRRCSPRARAAAASDADGLLGAASGGGGAPPKTKAPSKRVEVAGEKYLKCLTGVTALHLVLHGQASGKTTYEVIGGVKLPADVKACVDKVTAGIQLEAGAHADVDLTK